MKIKLLAVLLLACTTAVVKAQTETPNYPGIPKGFPKPGEIKVLPASEIAFPESVKKGMMRDIEEQKRKGYVHAKEEYAKYLLDLGNNKKLKIDETNSHPHDTNMKKSLSQ